MTYENLRKDSRKLRQEVSFQRIEHSEEIRNSLSQARATIILIN